jgi:2-oxoglutarate ferredoxin oxidoreductase subunit gamma
LAMHNAYWEPVRERLRPQALALVDRSAFASGWGEGTVGVRVIAVPAAEVARQLGFEGAAAMVALGAFAATSSLVSVTSLVDAVSRVLPPYRKQQAKLNAQAVRAGSELVTAIWPLPWSRLDTNPVGAER